MALSSLITRRPLQRSMPAKSIGGRIRRSTSFPYWPPTPTSRLPISTRSGSWTCWCSTISTRRSTIRRCVKRSWRSPIRTISWKLSPATRRIGRFAPRSSPAARRWRATPTSAALTGKRDFDKAKKLIAEAGYKGEKIVVLDAVDQPNVHGQALVAADLLKKLGLNVEIAASDWGNVVVRRASKKPIADGGWNVFCTGWSGADMLDPTLNQGLRSNGDKAWFGWPKDDTIEALAGRLDQGERFRRKSGGRGQDPTSCLRKPYPIFRPACSRPRPHTGKTSRALFKGRRSSSGTSRRCENRDG